MLDPRRRHSTKRNRNPVLINQSFRWLAVWWSGQVLFVRGPTTLIARVELCLVSGRHHQSVTFPKNYVIEFWRLWRSEKLSHDESIPNLPQIGSTAVIGLSEPRQDFVIGIRKILQLFFPELCRKNASQPRRGGGVSGKDLVFYSELWFVRFVRTGGRKKFFFSLCCGFPFLRLGG